MSVDDTGSEETRERQSIRDTFEEDTGGTEGRRGDVLSRHNVNSDTDSEVEAGNETLTHEDSFLVIALVAHLGCDGEAGIGRQNVA